MNSQKITNLATPTSENDAANKAYVDGARAGLDVKGSVRAATTANIALSGEQTVDGVGVVAGDRVLVKNQTTGSENGIYVVASGSWGRASDADTSDKVTSGMFTFVESGSTNGDTGWVLATDGSIAVGTTSLTFSKFTSQGEILAGDGMTKSGNTLNAIGTADRVSVSADAIDIASTYAGQSSITTLGTVTTGVWSATTIGVAKGGTNLTTVPKGSVMVANAADAFTALDGGGVSDGILLYTASTDTIAWATELDGGTF
jgi:phage-related tail fiber protein